MRLRFTYVAITLVWIALSIALPLLAKALLELRAQDKIHPLVVHIVPIGLFVLVLYLWYLGAKKYVKLKIKQVA